MNDSRQICVSVPKTFCPGSQFTSFSFVVYLFVYLFTSLFLSILNISLIIFIMNRTVLAIKLFREYRISDQRLRDWQLTISTSLIFENDATEMPTRTSTGLP